MGEVLFFIVIMLGVFFLLSSRSSKQKRALEDKSSDASSSTLPNAKTTQTPSTSKTQNTPGGVRYGAGGMKWQKQESLDAIYARENGLWVCERCETFNDYGVGYCRACGAQQTVR